MENKLLLIHKRGQGQRCSHISYPYHRLVIPSKLLRLCNQLSHTVVRVLFVFACTYPTITFMSTVSDFRLSGELAKSVLWKLNFILVLITLEKLVGKRLSPGKASL